MSDVQLFVSPASAAERSRVMVRPVDASPGVLWRRKGRVYRLTVDKGSMESMRSECARYGMYLWIPDSKEEWSFVEEILTELIVKEQTKYMMNLGYACEILIWTGLYNPSGSVCTLLDKQKSQCPFVDWRVGEPSLEDEKCVHFMTVTIDPATRFGGLKANDEKCQKDFYGLCEGRYDD